MPTIGSYGNYESRNILSPRVGLGSSMAMPITPQDVQDRFTERAFNMRYSENRGMNIIEKIGSYAAASVIDLGDSLWANNLIPGTERGDVWNFVSDYGGEIGKELEVFATRNQAAIETISGVGGAVGSAYLAGSLALPRISNALANSTAISGTRIWQMGSRMNALARSRMEDSMMQAALNGQMFKHFSGAGLKYTGTRALRMAGIGTFEEAAVVLAMNGNSTIWSNDMADNLMFAALGPGIGGALGTIQGRYEMRRLAQSPAMINARRSAIDPYGYTAAREGMPDPNVMSRISIAGSEQLRSATYTSLMVDARSIPDPRATPEMASRRETLRVNYEKQSNDVLQSIASQGVPGVPRSQFKIDGTAGRHLKEAGHADPTHLFGALNIGVLREESLDTVMQGTQDYIDSLKASNIAENIRKARDLEDADWRVMIDGSWYSAKHPNAAEYTRYKSGTTDFYGAPNTQEIRFTSDSGRFRKIDESFGMNGKFEDMPIVDREQMREAARKLSSNLRRTGTQVIMPASPSWFQIDAALAHEAAGGSVDWTTYAGIRNREDAILKSLQNKAAEIMTDPNRRLGNEWERLAFNLPAPNSNEIIYDMAGDQWRAILDAVNQGADLPTVTAMLEQMRRASGFHVKQETPELMGDLFGFGRFEDGQVKDPVLAIFQNEQVMKPFDEYGLATQLAENKLAVFNELTKQLTNGISNFIPDLTRRLFAMPEMHRAVRLLELSEDQVTGLGNPVTQAVGEILTKQMRYRDSPQLQAIQKIREAIERENNQYVSGLIDRNMGDVVERLSAGTGYKSKVLLNQFLSNSAGWDLEDDVVPLAGGFFAFTLKNTERNAQRLGRPLSPGDLLVNPRTGKEMVLDELGLEFMERFASVTDDILENRNRIRSAMGLDQLKRKAWYTPPPNTDKMFVGYTFDELNKPTPGGAIIAATRAEFNRLAAAKRATLPQGHTFRTREQVQATADLWDQAQMDWLSPGHVTAPSKGQTGSMFSELINPNAVGDVLTWVRKRGEELGSNTARVIFDQQIHIMRARNATERAMNGLGTGGGVRGRATEVQRTIWEEAENALLGRRAIDSGRSVSGAIARPIEAVTDSFLESAWPALKFLSPTQVNGWLQDLSSKMGAKIPGNAKSFDELAQALGPFTPFRHANDYMEQTLKVNRPAEVKKIAEKMNWLTSAMILRWFELPHAIMNMVGVITTLPSIARTGQAPLIASLGQGQNRLNIVDSGRIVSRGFKRMLSERSSADWNKMLADGNTSQSVMDYHQQMLQVTDRDSWAKVFLGTGSKSGATGLKGVYKEKGIDGLISMASDKTEGWSRTWAHFTGLELADLHGIVGLEARHQFAKDIADATIANYSPLNRPELFQSAFGSMFGLFMSWMQSYNQRLFRWMETGDYASIGRQMVWQSSLFGVASMPGYNQLESLLLSAGIGQNELGEEATMTDHIYARFGPGVGSLFLNGGLAESGIVLYTRGDMNYRDLSFDPRQTVAGINMANQVYNFITEAATTMLHSNSLSHNNALAEILARNMPNRVMKGTMAMLLNDGRDIDHRGQIVSETQSFLEGAIRAIGLRSTRQQAEIEAFYASERLKRREANRMEVLREETRSLLRQPGWESRMQEVFDKYVRTGGRPEHFRTWIRDNIRSAQSTRGVNDMVKALKSAENQTRAWRYNAYGAYQE